MTRALHFLPQPISTSLPAPTWWLGVCTLNIKWSPFQHPHWCEPINQSSWGIRDRHSRTIWLCVLQCDSVSFVCCYLSSVHVTSAATFDIKFTCLVLVRTESLPHSVSISLVALTPAFAAADGMVFIPWHVRMGSQMLPSAFRVSSPLSLLCRGRVACQRKRSRQSGHSGTCSHRLLLFLKSRRVLANLWAPNLQ